MRYLALCLAVLVGVLVDARALPPEHQLGLFTNEADVGAVAKPGSTTFDAARSEYTIAGSGENMWGERDAFHFVWRRITGDFILRSHVRFVGSGVEAHRKLGVIVRSSLDPEAPYADVAVHGDGLAALQFRRKAGATTEEVRSSVSKPDVVQIERRGETITMSVARHGDTFTSDRLSGLALADEVYVGLFVCSHSPNVVETGTFSNVRLVVPAKDTLVPYRDYIGSNLEILDLDTGLRRVVYTSPKSLQAPNWTTDGRALIYNSEGRLYRFDLATATPEAIDTGTATNNNNDHVLSFDGKWLAISHHTESDGGKSNVYVVPTTGGTPRRVTEQGPSYLHGWSPDGKSLVFTGERGGVFDIYRIPSAGGKEVRLTDAAGLDDGPEYTPDGRYIYFNSTRTGTMQIWRMRPDGSQQEQVTSDEFNNWFPHISPDGTRIVFLSFTKDVKPDDHPFYKRVYIRMMPISGGKPTVVAYVYGGQGTINVPSWSPDGRRIAFVTNTDTY